MEKITLDFQEAYDIIKESCLTISPDAFKLLNTAYTKETNEASKDILKSMMENVAMAKELGKPVCQSPGYPTVYVRFGDNADISSVKDNIPKALVQATKDGYLRPSIVHSLNRTNAGDNSGDGVPNFELQYCPGQEYLEIIISFKGCGAELGNIIKVMTTAQLGENLKGLKELILTAAIEAGGKPCPPVGIGIGIGGQVDVATKLSREAISTRAWNDENPDPQLNALEKELLADINNLKLGAAGIGGDTYCTAIKIGMAATHTAICPVSVNFHCWVARRMGIQLYPDKTRKYLFERGAN